MSGIQSRITRQAKKQESKPHNEKKNQPLKWLSTNTDVRMSRQGRKIVTIFHMFEKLGRNIKKTQVNIKTTMY